LACALCFAAMFAAGCGKSTIRTYEAQACSTNQSDDPFLLCSPAYDLICISTHYFPVTNPQEMVKWDGGVRPVWVCRLACVTDDDCNMGGDVCCPGMIYGKDYGKKAGCAPRDQCDALNKAPDAGGEDPVVDAAPPADAPAPDAPHLDAGADARDGGSDGGGQFEAGGDGPSGG
jgi:hypothetical protein